MFRGRLELRDPPRELGVLYCDRSPSLFEGCCLVFTPSGLLTRGLERSLKLDVASSRTTKLDEALLEFGNSGLILEGDPFELRTSRRSVSCHRLQLHVAVPCGFEVTSERRALLRNCSGLPARRVQIADQLLQLRMETGDFRVPPRKHLDLLRQWLGRLNGDRHRLDVGLDRLNSGLRLMRLRLRVLLLTGVGDRHRAQCQPRGVYRRSRAWASGGGATGAAGVAFGSANPTA